MKTSALLSASLFLLGSALVAQECPVLPVDGGYPVAVAAIAGDVDAGYLAASAQAATYRWRVPSRRRNAYRGWRRVSTRLLPPEPRWAEDWRPEARHRAALHVVVRRNGDIHIAEVGEESGDDRFDESLASIFEEPMPASPDLPSFPTTVTADSIVLRMVFGSVIDGGVVVRFAAHQTAVKMVPGTMRFDIRRQQSTTRARVQPVTMKYDVLVDGSVDPRSVQIVRSSGPLLDRALEEGVLRARFEPATSNCRAIAQTVVQTFGGNR